MIPVDPQPEPPDFEATVRQPGNGFLADHPNPSNWDGKSYWQNALPSMRKAYKKTCAFSAQWIPHATGNHSIEHFQPKSLFPHLAYEWTNFRYVSARLNSRKGTKTVIDPFHIRPDWFILDFSTFFVKPNPDPQVLPAAERTVIENTIAILKLNEDDLLVEERMEFFRDYKSRDIGYNYLKRQAPFIAYEVKRQGLMN
jgi:hypothetical protein